MHKSSTIHSLLFGVVAVLLSSSHGAPTPESNKLSASDIATLTNSTGLADIIANGGDFTVYNQTTNSNGTEKQLYVIKAVVYEVGILTEIDDNSTESNESHERVDLTFFNAHRNGSAFDFGDIPVPIQANITGHTYTEILPLHIGDGGVMNISEIASILPLPEHVLNFTRNHDTLFQYQSSPYHYNDKPQQPDETPSFVATEEQPLPIEHLAQHQQHHQHLNQEDLLKIPIIPNSIVVDYERLEEDLEKEEEKLIKREQEVQQEELEVKKEELEVHQEKLQLQAQQAKLQEQVDCS